MVRAKALYPNLIIMVSKEFSSGSFHGKCLKYQALSNKTAAAKGGPVTFDLPDINDGINIFRCRRPSDHESTAQHSTAQH